MAAADLEQEYKSTKRQQLGVPAVTNDIGAVQNMLSWR
jgi:hypothetical protein